MSPDVVRLKFVAKYGKTKYIEFVLSLYEYFPRRSTLFFWQDNLVSDLFKELDINNYDLDEIYRIFNFCPLHDIELLPENVPVVDGENCTWSFDITLRKELFPLANICAPRDLSRFSYPRVLKVYYCSVCRQIQATKMNHIESSE